MDFALVGLKKIDFFDFSGTKRVKRKSICNLVTGDEIIKVFFLILFVQNGKGQEKYRNI